MIKSLCLSLSLLITSNVYSSTESIFYRLKQVSGLTNAKLFYENCDVGAYAQNGNVTVCYETLSNVRNDDEIARVLGHELGHIANGDMSSSKGNEYRADASAAVYMRAAGYNVCRGAALIKRRNLPESSDHPSDYNRWLMFNCK